MFAFSLYSKMNSSFNTKKKKKVVSCPTAQAAPRTLFPFLMEDFALHSSVFAPGGHVCLVFAVLRLGISKVNASDVVV